MLMNDKFYWFTTSFSHQLWNRFLSCENFTKDEGRRFSFFFLMKSHLLALRQIRVRGEGERVDARKGLNVGRGLVKYKQLPRIFLAFRKVLGNIFFFFSTDKVSSPYSWKIFKNLENKTKQIFAFLILINNN